MDDFVTIKIPLSVWRIVKAESETFESLDEDFNPQDYTGGNFEDTFDLGANHGSEEMARYVVKNSVEVG
jgi:hypothetical protein